jgi:hypothetical protein
MLNKPAAQTARFHPHFILCINVPLSLVAAAGYSALLPPVTLHCCRPVQIETAKALPGENLAKFLLCGYTPAELPFVGEFALLLRLDPGPLETCQAAHTGLLL